MSYLFSKAELDSVYKAISERRDMRHFSTRPVDEEIMQRILHAGHQAPNVGLIQPWRFIRVFDSSIRQSIHKHVHSEIIKTAESLSGRKEEFLKLKVEGINDADQLVVVCVKPHQSSETFGRRTMPEMDLASTACAIQNMWLAARVENIGMGWVSMFDPNYLCDLLKMPEGAKPIAILSIGHVDRFYKQPMLVEKKWSPQKTLKNFIFENHWPEDINH